jgi:hypothetical protein
VSFAARFGVLRWWIVVAIAIGIGLMGGPVAPLVVWAISILLLPLALVAGGIAVVLYAFGPKKEK